MVEYFVMADRVVPIKDTNMKTYVFKVVLEEDFYPDGRPAWHVYCPALVEQGASTFGHTREEALKNIQEVLHGTVEELLEEGEEIPAKAIKDDERVQSEVLVTV